MAVGLFHRDDRVTQLDQVLLLHVEQLLPNFLGLLFGRKRDFYEIGHCLYPMLLRNRLRLSARPSPNPGPTPNQDPNPSPDPSPTRRRASPSPNPTSQPAGPSPSRLASPNRGPANPNRRRASRHHATHRHATHRRV